MVSSHHIMEDGLISSLLHWMMGRVAVLELEEGSWAWEATSEGDGERELGLLRLNTW